MNRVEGHPIPFRAKLLALGALGVAGPVLVACASKAGGPEVSGQGGNGGNTEPVATRTVTSEIPATSVVPTETISIPEPTATEEAKVLTFDEISRMVADAYNITQIPTGLCNLEQLSFMITNSKTAREGYDQDPVDFSPYANAYGRLVGEVQKVVDSTGSQTFINLQKTLEDSLYADMREIASKRGFTEQDVQGFLATWRSNWLDRGSQNYDALRCGIVLPKD